LLRIKDPPRVKQETTQFSEGFLLVTGYWLLVTGLLAAFWWLSTRQLATGNQQPAASNQQLATSS
jgi:hypothetical protein